MTPTMRAGALVGAIVLAGCAHRVRLDTTPSGATAIVNGIHVGETPVDFKERTGWNKRHDIELRKAGYKPVRQTVRQTEWHLRLVGPALPLIWCPLVWPAMLFSKRSRHGYHWDLEPDRTQATDPAGVDGALPADYPVPDLPTDYPPPPPEAD